MALVPTGVAGTRRARGRTSTTCARRAAPRRALRRGGRACPVPLARSTTRSCASSPSVDRGERFNAGVVLFCRQRASWRRGSGSTRGRLAALAPDLRAERRARPPRRARRGSRRAIRTQGPSRDAAVGALRLARRTLEHDRPALRGPHGAIRGPCWHARSVIRRTRGAQWMTRARSRARRCRPADPRRRWPAPRGTRLDGLRPCRGPA